MPIAKIAALGFAAVLGTTLMVGSASAMPVNGQVAAAAQRADGLKDVRWVCGPYRCWWRPGPYWGGPYWGPRPWHHWHRRWW
ncbi:MAG TPA: hypothetical protein VEK75_12265 [Xanthobacteraceae bacterium]|nr:hypothetical protein [Xanthobacteraceae bacterium]